MKPTLLIADGDAELCDLYRTFIAARGYRVETASDGLDCLAKLRQATPAAVMLDGELPWGGSDGVLAWLREERATSDVAVILTATAWPPRGVTQGFEPPVTGILLKPFPLTVLLERVRSAVASKTWRGTPSAYGSTAKTCPVQQALPGRFLGSDRVHREDRGLPG
jgi:DNA-binding response OmpR family regulator